MKMSGTQGKSSTGYRGGGLSAKQAKELLATPVRKTTNLKSQRVEQQQTPRVNKAGGGFAALTPVRRLSKSNMRRNKDGEVQESGNYGIVGEESKTQPLNRMQGRALEEDADNQRTILQEFENQPGALDAYFDSSSQREEFTPSLRDQIEKKQFGYQELSSGS